VVRAEEVVRVVAAPDLAQAAVLLRGEGGLGVGRPLGEVEVRAVGRPGREALAQGARVALDRLPGLGVHADPDGEHEEPPV